MIKIAMLIAVAACCSAPFSGARAQFGQRDQVQAPPQPPERPPPVTQGEPGATEAIQSASEQPKAATAYATPQTNDRQIADLQQAVSELQSEVERLRAQVTTLTPPEGEYYLTNRRPHPTIRCSAGATITMNTFRLNLLKIEPRNPINELNDQTITTHPSFFGYSNCRSTRGQ